MLSLRIKQHEQIPIDVFQILPETVATLTLSQILEYPIRIGNREEPLGSAFDVTGDPSDLHHSWAGDLQLVSGIGFGMRRGWIQVNGNAGHHLGARMAGGTIHVQGEAGDFVGAESTGGLIHVRGNVGNHAGAAYDAGKPGMNGGRVLIDGSAGDDAGFAMRRGLLAIANEVGDRCGYCMRAGTIMAWGTVGQDAGMEMIRGTLVLAKNQREKQGQGSNWQTQNWDYSGRLPFAAGSILNKQLKELGFGQQLPTERYHTWHGDPLHGNRGELLAHAD